jgi:hypothetical protein
VIAGRTLALKIFHLKNAFYSPAYPTHHFLPFVHVAHFAFVR